ncbi:MAG: hypothetical protein K5892_01675 [Acholeplasmatales bacterium]|nr:hypothetical protein [Acholeplasmatales bacterium]
MTCKFFFENYDLNDLDINSIYIKDNKLYLDVRMEGTIPLIANGYRPEMDIDERRTFIFNVNHNDKKYSNNISMIYKDNLIFFIDGEEIITFENVLVKK